MNELKVIEQREVLGVDFRIYGDFDNPLFLAKDVAEWIEHSDVSTMLRAVDENEKLTQTMFVSGQNREMWFLTEDGLYEILMSSRKPIAKEFKSEVKKILRDVRRHGAYLTDEKVEEILTSPDTIIRLATIIKEERAEKERLQLEAAENRPKVVFADSVAASRTSCLIGQLAKVLCQNGVDIGEKRLFTWLRENGYLIRRKGIDWNAPTQKSVDLGILKVVMRPVNNPDGTTRITRTTLVTGKGQIYFINKFLAA